MAQQPCYAYPHSNMLTRGTPTEGVTRVCLRRMRSDTLKHQMLKYVEVPDALSTISMEKELMDDNLIYNCKIEHGKII